MTQICLRIPALAAPLGERLLAEALAAARIAAVVVTPDLAGAITPAAALPLIAAGQTAGAAVMITGDAHLARTLKADGVHLPWDLEILARAEEAREILGQGGIVGADAGVSRHDAMELGEQGVDYVAFGPAGDADPGTAREDRDEYATWWAEIFEVPVVALDVAEADEAAALAAANVDFVSVTLSGGEDVQRLRAISEAVAATRVEPAV